MRDKVFKVEVSCDNIEHCDEVRYFDDVDDAKANDWIIGIFDYCGVVCKRMHKRERQTFTRV